MRQTWHTTKLALISCALYVPVRSSACHALCMVTCKCVHAACWLSGEGICNSVIKISGNRAGFRGDDPRRLVVQEVQGEAPARRHPRLHLWRCIPVRPGTPCYNDNTAVSWLAAAQQFWLRVLLIRVCWHVYLLTYTRERVCLKYANKSAACQWRRTRGKLDGTSAAPCPQDHAHRAGEGRAHPRHHHAHHCGLRGVVAVGAHLVVAGHLPAGVRPRTNASLHLAALLPGMLMVTPAMVGSANTDQLAAQW